MEIPGFEFDPVLKRYFKKINQNDNYRLQIPKSSKSSASSISTPKSIARKAGFCNNGPFPFLSARVTCPFQKDWRPLALISWLKSEAPVEFKISFCDMDRGQVLFRKDETFILYFRQGSRIMMRKQDRNYWYYGVGNISTFYQCNDDILLFSDFESFSVVWQEDQSTRRFWMKPPSCCLADIKSGNLYLGYHDKILKVNPLTLKVKERVKIQSEALSMHLIVSHFV